MTKTLNTTSLMNELQEGSAFFKSPVPSRTRREPPVEPTQREDTHPPEPTHTRTDAPNERTERTSERSHRTLLHELQSNEVEETRPTERYSFEIYSDQKQSIEDVQYRYKKKSGRKLSASRIIREALEDYLKKAEKMLSSI
jgi:hypothetical protein